MNAERTFARPQPPPRRPHDQQGVSAELLVAVVGIPKGHLLSRPQGTSCHHELAVYRRLGLQIRTTFGIFWRFVVRFEPTVGWPRGGMGFRMRARGEPWMAGLPCLSVWVR